jgi:hypothetical protein
MPKHVVYSVCLQYEEDKGTSIEFGRRRKETDYKRQLYTVQQDAAI